MGEVDRSSFLVGIISSIQYVLYLMQYVTDYLLGEKKTLLIARIWYFTTTTTSSTTTTTPNSLLCGVPQGLLLQYLTSR